MTHYFKHSFKLKYILIIIPLLSLSGCTTFQASDEMILFNDQPLKEGMGLKLPEGYSAQFQKMPVHEETELYTSHISKSQSSYTVLYFGGNGFRIAIQGYEKAWPITRNGGNVFLFDYRGYGYSDGRSSFAHLKKDGVALFDTLVHRNLINPEKTILHGHSIGSLVAAHVAQEREVSGLVLESSVTTMKEWWKAVTPWFVRPLIRFEVDSTLKGQGNLPRVRELELPTLFIAGGADPITPPELTEKLYQNSSAPNKMLHIFKGSDHNTVMEHAQFDSVYTGFLDAIPLSD